MMNVNEVNNYITDEVCYAMAEVTAAAPNDGIKFEVSTRDIVQIFCYGILNGAGIALEAVNGNELPHGKHLCYRIVNGLASKVDIPEFYK